MSVCVYVVGGEGAHSIQTSLPGKCPGKKRIFRRKNTAELIERVCAECLAQTLDRLQTWVTSACKQPTRSRRFGNMVLNVNYSRIRREEKQMCPRRIQRATASLSEPFGCFDRINEGDSRKTRCWRREGFIL